MSQFKSIQLILRIPDHNIQFVDDFIEKNAAIEVKQLFHYSLTEYREGQSDREIWLKCFKNTTFNKQLFASYCHQLLNKVEQAICLLNLKGKSLKYYDTLLPVLLDWDALDHYQFSTKKTQKLLNKAVGHDYFSYYKHRFEYLQFKSLEKESSRKADLNINEASNTLDEYYILLKLRYLCAALSHQKITSATYEIRFIELIIPAIEQSYLVATPLIKNYLLIYKMLNDVESDEGFQELKTHLIRDRATFSHSELNEIYIYPINFCIQKINNGQLNYRQELLDIYKSLPGFNVTSEEIISPWRFRNVVHLALMEGDFKWAENFIGKFSHRLLKEYRENAVNYNMANLRFHEKRYEEVIPLLIHVEYQDINYALICKILLLKTYYEMNEQEVFHSLLESFRLFIMRSKDITSFQRKKYLDFLSIMRKLAKMEFASLETVDRFKMKTKAKEIIADKPWILEKLEEL